MYNIENRAPRHKKVDKISKVSWKPVFFDFSGFTGQESSYYSDIDSYYKYLTTGIFYDTTLF